MQIWQQLVKMEEEAQSIGLTWPNAQTILEQIESECREIRECLESSQKHEAELKEEIADLLHATTSLAWYCGYDSHELLSFSCEKFAKRLQMMQVIAGEEGVTTMQGSSFEELMALWNKAKQRLVKD